MAAKPQQRYRVLERIASGGMAEVYLAESAGVEGFKKKVAIKRVLPHLSEKKRFIAMFLDEARLSAQLNHSNIAHVFDIGVGDNSYFIVMEHVEGADLKELMTALNESGRTMPLEAALYVTSKLCEGLAYAHELTGHDGQPLHAVHRDMSPPNVLLSRHGEVKIVDFGLAKASSQLEKSEAGIIKGKYSYLSPEAANGLEVDARADIFSLGILLWEMLAGRKLFQGANDYETVKLVQVAEVPSIASINPDASHPELQAILERALARERDNRYPSARDFGRDLTTLLFGLGRPVDAFAIAELVQLPLARRRVETTTDDVPMFGAMIDDALLKFTSIREKQQSQSGVMAEPVLSLRGHALEPDRAPPSLDLRHRLGGSEAARLVRHSLPAGAFEDGNLAALEEVAVTMAPRPAASVATPPPTARSAGTAPTRPNPTVVVLLTLVVALAATALWLVLRG